MTEQERIHERRNMGMLGRRASDNFDSHLMWLKTEYIDPTVETTLAKAQDVWIGIVRAELAEAREARREADMKRDHERDWRTVRISVGVSLLMTAVYHVFSFLKGWR